MPFERPRVVTYAGVGVLTLGLVLFVSMYVGTLVQRSGDDDITLADPPSGAISNPHAPNAVIVPASERRLAGADRLYEEGMKKSSPDELYGGYEEFKECVAFYPEDVRCLRALGIAAYEMARYDPGWSEQNREARHAFQNYLELVPDTDERERIEGLLAELDTASNAPPDDSNGIDAFPDDGKARLILVTDPPGATIFIDREKKGITPKTLEGFEPSGSYEVSFALNGHRAVNLSVDIGGASVRVVDARLQRLADTPSGEDRKEARIVVRSRPSGATVVFGGTDAGATPLQLTGVDTSRAHELVLHKAGYRSKRVKIEFRGDELATIDVALEKSEERRR